MFLEHNGLVPRYGFLFSQPRKFFLDTQASPPQGGFLWPLWESLDPCPWSSVCFHCATLFTTWHNRTCVLVCSLVSVTRMWASWEQDLVFFAPCWTGIALVNVVRYIHEWKNEWAKAWYLLRCHRHRKKFQGILYTGNGHLVLMNWGACSGVGHLLIRWCQSPVS